MTTHKLRVFISYAWESEEHKIAVWDLAGWLESNSNGEIKVITDHLYENRPPKQGWPAWMVQEIDQADVVLIVCTPKYKTRFQKEDEAAGGGAGVNFEGAIVTQGLYTSKMRNEKFFPVLPDGGDRNNIPIILQAFDNGHKFPSGNEKILKLIYNDNPKHLHEISEAISSAPTEAKNGVLEKEIVEGLIENIEQTLTNNEKRMMTPVQIVVRTFLQLSESSKISIAKALAIFESSFDDMRPVDRDKAIFVQIKNKSLLYELWEQINKISPFEDNINPFNKTPHDESKS